MDTEATHDDELSQEEERGFNDSWNALDDLTFPCRRSGKYSSCVNVYVNPNDFDDRQFPSVPFNNTFQIHGSD